ncbi:thiosulfate sulfurtransferase/rhodanese-like domain-containing protein 3 [Phacochoerus africanus]|uniref:thiosulfate sulfurtransferase/rhodanese-like domain-containing protein 3 n=1 Tax=Phacochoerus africanus TaxID=41426 RepID=UPI001FD95569|nr:thiosulfate sulfurtransferase/rhodanese-like domain-containing protein 3 [Phacochoerus africanus]
MELETLRALESPARLHQRREEEQEREEGAVGSPASGTRNGAAAAAARECAPGNPRVRGGCVLGLKSIKGSYHNFCTAVCKDVTYTELKSLLKSKKNMLIDVRETWEILECGKIPGSVSIPLDDVGKALQMSPKDFKEKYNEVKPSKSNSLVFSCLAGVRSKKALNTAVSLGFNSAQHYAGRWKEWATYEFSEKKQGN